MVSVGAISTTVLQVRLPEPYCRELIKTVEAAGLATDYSICSDDIPRLTLRLRGLTCTMRSCTMPITCRAVFHTLL